MNLRQKLLVTMFAPWLILFLPRAQAQDSQQQPPPASIPQPRIPASPEEEGWQGALSAYLWFPGTHGTIGAGNNNVSIHASAGDLLSNVRFGITGAADAEYGRVLLNGDLTWVRLGDESSVGAPGGGALAIDARSGELIWTSKVGYRVVQYEHFKVDATAGLRYWHLTQRLKLNPPGLDISGSRDWADFVVGGRVHLPVGSSDKAGVEVGGDVGGWGVSAELDYQFGAILTYRTSPHWKLLSGYRYMFIDHRDGPSVYSVVTSGPVFGAVYGFK